MQALIFERDVDIPMRDGGVLRCNVYRPVGEGVFPVIMTMGPYGKDRNWADRNPEQARKLGGGAFINWETPDPEVWVPKGYAIVRVDGRGSGASPGYLNPLSSQIAEDYYDAIEWAGTQSWSAGKVGLLGISYYAMSQWVAAALNPPHLAALAAWEGAADLYRDFLRQGGILSNAFPGWWWPGTVLNVQHGTDGSLGEEERARNTFPSLVEKALEHPFNDEMYTDWTADLSKIDVPLLSVGNWGNVGLHLRGNIAAYTDAASKDKWLRIEVGDHVGPFYTPEALALQERFFGTFLKGEDHGWADRRPVELLIRSEPEHKWRAENEWPLARTEWTDFYLDAHEAGLGTTAPTRAGQVSYAPLKDVLSFSTPVCDAEMEITGPVNLTLWLSSQSNDADVFVRLGKIRADGTEQWGIDPQNGDCALTQGWLRASHRELDAEKSKHYLPVHVHQHKMPLVPGEPVELEIEIWATSIVCEEGSRLVLDVSGHELAGGYFKHTDETDRPVDVFGAACVLYTGPAHPSRLKLPVIPK